MTEVEKLLTTLKLPKDFELLISLENFKELFYNSSEYDDFLYFLSTMEKDVNKKYGIETSLYLITALIISIQISDGEIICKFDWLSLIRGLYVFFNANIFPDIDIDNNMDKAKIIKNVKSFLREKQRQLADVKNIDELRGVSEILWNSYQMEYEKVKLGEISSQKLASSIEINVKKYVAAFKKINIWIESYVDDLSSPFIFKMYDKIDIDKFRLFLALQILVNVDYFPNDFERNLLADEAKRLYDSIRQKNIEFKRIYFVYLKRNKPEDCLNGCIDCNYFEVIYKIFRGNLTNNDDFVRLFEKFSGGNKINMKEMNNFVTDYIEQHIKKIEKLGAETVENIELENTISKLEQELKSNNFDKRGYKQKLHQLKKLKMVFEDIKPVAIQKGLGKFKDYNVYYYDNGMVAMDKIDYGVALYVMPISTYKYIVEHKVNNLFLIRKMNAKGVKYFINPSSEKWLEDAKKAILGGSPLVSEIDCKISDEISSWDFEFTCDDIVRIDALLDEIKSSNLTKAEKEEKLRVVKTKMEQNANEIKFRKQKAKQIDMELKNSNPESDLRLSEIKELRNLENELDNKYGNDVSFEFLYEQVQKSNKKVKRNPAVSKYCKDRNLDENGQYHCEICGDEIPKERRRYLEAHHFVPISKGGPDTIYNTICVCKYCHEDIHEDGIVSVKMKSEALSIIEKHIGEENPELLEEFYEYRTKFFPTINGLLSEERYRIKKELWQEGITVAEYGEENFELEVDERIREFEQKLDEEYKKNPRKYEENFELEWHFKRKLRCK